MRFSSLVGVALSALVASAVTAQAQERVQAGILECHGGQNVGMIIASETVLDCLYTADGRRPEPYQAKITRIGVDLGVTQETRFAWAVQAPIQRLGPGDLAGNYGGVGGNVSVGVGGGGNILIGGSQNSFALQPLSVQGQTGVNVAGGIVGLELRPAVLERPHGRHHRRHGRHHRRHH